MEFIKIDPSKTTSEEIAQAITLNCKTIKLMKKEIEKLEKINQDYCNSAEKRENSNNESVETDEITITSDTQKTDFDNKIDYYYSLIDLIPISEKLNEEREATLPSDKNVDYNDIIMRLKLELYKNIKELKEFIEEESLSLDELREFREEIKTNQLKIDSIDYINNEKDKKESADDNKENNLIFVPTEGGNIRIIDEIKRIDVDFLPAFKKLFDSIKDGTFKNVKRYNNNKNYLTSSVAEVKDFKIRVVFDRISKSDYALITAFIKKSDNDRGYRNSLDLKIMNYLKQKDRLKELINDDEYMKEQSLLEKELYSCFTSDTLTGEENKNGSIVKTNRRK